MDIFKYNRRLTKTDKSANLSNLPVDNIVVKICKWGAQNMKIKSFIIEYWLCYYIEAIIMDACNL